MPPSMGSVGGAYDNSLCESFFATFGYELLDRRRFRTQAEAPGCHASEGRGLKAKAGM